MNSLAGHFLILAGAAAAIAVMSLIVDWPRATPLVQTAPVPQDASLTREIQRELKRVGCYDGQIDGKWAAQSRLAMKNFTDNASSNLPIDRPDYSLLRLAQAHHGKACDLAGSKGLLPPPPSLLYEGHAPKDGTRPN